MTDLIKTAKPTAVTIVRPDLTGREATNVLAATAVNIFAGAWVLMLCLGGLHHQLDPRIPAAGYWTTILIVLVADQLFNRNTTFRVWTRPVRAVEK